MAQTIRLRRGLEANLPSTGLSIGEPLYSTDFYNVYVADSTTTWRPATPNIGELNTIVTPNNSDLLMIHDVSETLDQREKGITFANFKAALNIPAGSTDELVAATNGSTAGYLDEILISSAGTLTFSVSTNDLDLDIADGAVDSVHLATDAVTTIKIGNDQVTNAKIAAGAVDTTELANDAVTQTKIAAGAVDTTELANDAVTNAKIAGGAVDTTELADDAVTNAKLDPAALSLGAVFSGNGVTTALGIASGGISNAMLAATALNLNGTTFSGNGTTTQLDVEVIDGGTF